MAPVLLFFSRGRWFLGISWCSAGGLLVVPWSHISPGGLVLVSWWFRRGRGGRGLSRVFEVF